MPARFKAFFPVGNTPSATSPASKRLTFRRSVWRSGNSRKHDRHRRPVEITVTDTRNNKYTQSGEMKMTRSLNAAALAAGLFLATAGLALAQGAPPPDPTGPGAATGTTPGTGADTGAGKTSLPATPAGPAAGTNPSVVGTGDSQTKTGTGDRPSASSGTSQGGASSSASSSSSSSSSGKKKSGRHSKKGTSSGTSANGSAAAATQ